MAKPEKATKEQATKEQATKEQGPILLYDGDCGLCNRGIRFLMKRDPKRHLRFAALESTFGQEKRALHGISESDDTMVLLEGDRVATYSSAGLGALKYLRFPWPLFRFLRIVPRPLRDAIYRFVAKHRKRWQPCSCSVLSPEDRARFIDE